MKLTNRQMDEYLYSLNQIASKTKGKLAFAIAKNMRVMQNELIEYHKIKDGLIQKYGEPSDNGGFQLNIESDAFKEFIIEMKEYDSIESDVNIIMVEPEQVYESSLDSYEMMQILFMVREE